MVRNDVKDYMILPLLASANLTVLINRHSTVATADPVTAVTYSTVPTRLSFSLEGQKTISCPCRGMCMIYYTLVACCEYAKY